MKSEENHDISQELNKENYKEDVNLLEKAKEKMVAMELFDKKFIDGLNFTFVDITVKDGRNEEVEYRLDENGSFIPYDNENSDRSKEVGMITRSYLDKVEQLFDSKSKINKGQQVWLGKLDKTIFLSFDAAAVHEIAHAKSYDVIDEERKSLFDEEKFKDLIVEITKEDPVLSKKESVDLSKFKYSDTNWSELYALLYHREFLREDNGNNNEMIKEWDKHIIEVANDLPGAMEKLNQERNIDIDPEVIYKDGHAFSYLLARVFEEKYTDFNERIKVLEQCKHDNNDSEEMPTEQKEINLAQQKWDKGSERTEKIEDSLGCSVDENIKETVTAFNVFEINTSGSCEGHIDQGCGVPWVEVAAYNEPDEYYVNEKSIIERIALENNISVDGLRKEEKYEAIFQQAKNEFEKNGKTEKAIAWQEENEKLRAVMEDVIFDFYQDRDVLEDMKLKFRSIGDLGEFKILSGTHEDYERDSETMSGAEKEELGKRLEKYRKEMKDFTDFLKEKLFDEGEGYMNDKKSKAREKVDKEKISKIRKQISLNF